MLSLGGLTNPNMIFGSLVSEQEKLASNAVGTTKAYTDCEGYKKFTESQGISKEDADSNTEAVNTRIDELQSDIIRNPWSEAQQVKIDENECLREIRLAEMEADRTFPNTLKTSSEVENSSETINYLPYSNDQLGISFEYPSDWNVEEKTNRFSDAPADVEVYDGLNSFKYQQDKRNMGEFDSLDLELMAQMTLNSLTSVSGTSLVEGISMDKYQVDGKDTATFLIKTESSTGQNSFSNPDYATQVFIIDNNNGFDIIMYQNSLTEFDSPESQEILSQMLDSFQFLDSEQNEEITTSENNED